VETDPTATATPAPKHCGSLVTGKGLSGQECFGSPQSLLGPPRDPHLDLSTLLGFDVLAARALIVLVRLLPRVALLWRQVGPEIVCRGAWVGPVYGAVFETELHVTRLRQLIVVGLVRRNLFYFQRHRVVLIGRYEADLVDGTFPDVGNV
jgi:hypothetical protein